MRWQRNEFPPWKYDIRISPDLHLSNLPASYPELFKMIAGLFILMPAIISGKPRFKDYFLLLFFKIQLTVLSSPFSTGVIV